LHLMIWMCLKAKYPSSRGYYRFINYIIETIHTPPYHTISCIITYMKHSNSLNHLNKFVYVDSSEE
jgi:hypothetical protein